MKKPEPPPPVRTPDGSHDISRPELKEVQDQLIELIRKETTKTYPNERAILSFLDAYQVPTDVLDSPEVDQVKADFIRKIWGPGSGILVGQIFTIASRLRISKHLQRDPEINRGIRDQIRAYFASSFSSTKETLEKIRRFDELEALLELNAEESRKCIQDIIEAHLGYPRDYFEKIRAIANYFKIPPDELKEIVSDYIANCYFTSGLAQKVVDAAKEFECEVRAFVVPCKKAMIRTIQVGSVRQVVLEKEKVGITDEECAELIGQVIEAKGIEVIIVVLDEIPSSILAYLETPYALQSYKKEMSVPLINIRTYAFAK